MLSIFSFSVCFLRLKMHGCYYVFFTSFNLAGVICCHRPSWRKLQALRIAWLGWRSEVPTWYRDAVIGCRASWDSKSRLTSKASETVTLPSAALHREWVRRQWAAGGTDEQGGMLMEDEWQDCAKRCWCEINNVTSHRKVHQKLYHTDTQAFVVSISVMLIFKCP